MLTGVFGFPAAWAAPSSVHASRLGPISLTYVERALECASPMVEDRPADPELRDDDPWRTALSDPGAGQGNIPPEERKAPSNYTDGNS